MFDLSRSTKKQILTLTLCAETPPSWKYVDVTTENEFSLFTRNLISVQPEFYYHKTPFSDVT